MPLIPLAIDKELKKRPLVAAIVGCVILYQVVLITQFASLKLPVELIPQRSYADLALYSDFLLGLFRGPGPFTGILIFIFWLTCGSLLENAAGRWMTAIVFLGGALLPFFLAREGWIAWERNYWPGLGGVMACLGLAYYKVWEDEIRVFFVLPLPPKAGITNISSLFFIVILHVVLTLAQYVTYRASKGEVPPEAFPTIRWIFLLPFAVLAICLLARHSRRLLRREEFEDN